MNDLKERKKKLLKKLEKITVEKSETRRVILSKQPVKITVSSNYDKKEFGFAAGEFVKTDQGLALCIGVGKNPNSRICGCGCSATNIKLWFVTEKGETASYWGDYRAKDFSKKEFELIS